MKTIGYIHESDPFHDRKAWSGTIFKIREAIENAGFNVIWIPCRIPVIKDLLFKSYIKLRYGKTAITTHNPYVYKELAKSIDKALIEKCDYIFFPGGVQLSIFLNFRKPIIYYSDATIHILLDYYFHNQPKAIITEAEKYEALGIKRADLCIMSSDWAINSVIHDYHYPKEKTKVLEFGPNLDIKDLHNQYKTPSNQLNILLSGVDYVRKGGAIAIETTKLLRNKGINAVLTIVGMKNIPKEKQKLSFVKIVGFLNKNIEKDYNEYINIWRNSHILLLPTQAECSAIVYCEAAAFGIPVFTYETGGVSNYVLDRISGRCLVRSSSATNFANAIIEALNNNKLKEYSEGQLQLYHSKLNWEIWSQRFKNIMSEQKF